MKVGLFESNSCIELYLIGQFLILDTHYYGIQICIPAKCDHVEMGNAFVSEHNIIYPTMFMTSGIITIDI